jgi:hypothetical protein
MKILDAQAAVLTNVEVYQFLQKQAKEYQEQKRRGPGNLETLRREVRSSDIEFFLSGSLISSASYSNILRLTLAP